MQSPSVTVLPSKQKGKGKDRSSSRVERLLVRDGDDDEAEKTAIPANFSTDVMERAAVRTTWKVKCEALPLAPSLTSTPQRKQASRNRAVPAAPLAQLAHAPVADVSPSAEVPPPSQLRSLTVKEEWSAAERLNPIKKENFSKHFN